MLANCIKFTELKHLFVKKKPKTPISGHLAEVPAESSALPTPKFRPIRHDLSPDLAVGGANGWRCSNQPVHTTRLNVLGQNASFKVNHSHSMSAVVSI
jgi:hypothetical protein